MFADPHRADRERFGLWIAQPPWRLAISPAEYRRIEDGAAWPEWETLHRICGLFGWPQTFRQSLGGQQEWQQEPFAASPSVHNRRSSGGR
jgi:hypothetical protein